MDDIYKDIYKYKQTIKLSIASLDADIACKLNDECMNEYHT